MNLKIKKGINTQQAIQLPYSKSISNRLLIMQALEELSFGIKNLSIADDTIVLEKALETKSNVIDVGMAGTAFRFLTAYFSVKNQALELTGHSRMLERPIRDLIDALRELGGKIEYLGQEGFPPIQIKESELLGDTITIRVDKSSQYLSALLLVAPYLPQGLKIQLQGNLVSKPYAEMTCKLMKQLGAKLNWEGNLIEVEAGKYKTKKTIMVESDWSSAAFFYQYFACSNLESLEILGLTQNSIQGDAVCANLFDHLGVQTTYTANGVILTKKDININSIEIDLTDAPDLIPSFSIAAVLLLQEVYISGVQTLRIKESDRIEALKFELAKIGIELSDLSNSKVCLRKKEKLPKKARFQVYNDHRMVMSLAMMISCMEEVIVEDAEVVSKSFPSFWKEFEKLGSTQSVS